MNRIQRRIKAVNSPGSNLRITGGKVIGQVTGTTARFKVSRSRHFFRNYGGYSLDAGVIGELERRGIQVVEFEDTELRAIFRVLLDTFISHARHVEYGYGPKLVCPEKFYINEATDLLPGLDLMKPRVAVRGNHV